MPMPPRVGARRANPGLNDTIPLGLAKHHSRLVRNGKPPGRGSIVRRVWAKTDLPGPMMPLPTGNQSEGKSPRAMELSASVALFSLSPGERAGVRGKKPSKPT